MASASPSLRRLLGRRMWIVAYGPILFVTALHFATPTHAHGAHDILRRLYYLPILLGAFACGWRGGLAASLFTAVAYIPHGFIAIGMHDPGRPMEKILELLLYQVVPSSRVSWSTASARSARARSASPTGCRRLSTSCGRRSASSSARRASRRWAR